MEITEQMGVFEIAEALGKELKKDARLLRLDAAKKAFDADEALGAMMAEYRVQNMAIENAAGVPTDEGVDVTLVGQIQARIDALYQQITTHALYVELEEAQNEVNELMNAVNNTFCYTLMTTKEYKAPAYSTEKNKNFFYYPSHTLLVDRAKLVLKSQPSNLTVTGGKTGFTDESRHCLATCGVAADGTRYVSVTAQAQTQVDTITDYITIYETYAK